MAWLFWLSIGAIVYVYAGYPFLLRVWAFYCGLRNADCGLDCGLISAAQSTISPQSIDPQSAINPQSAVRNPPYGISIVIAARNEAARLGARIDNLLSLDYPA